MRSRSTHHHQPEGTKYSLSLVSRGFLGATYNGDWGNMVGTAFNVSLLRLLCPQSCSARSVTNSQARSEPSTRRSTEEDTDLRAESSRAKQLSGACLAGVDGTKLQSSSLNDSYIRGPYSAAFRRLAYANYIETYAGSLNDVTCHTHEYIINNILYYIS